ncbi:MAG: MFS transporter [Anaerolineae bacterium]|nr:MFS transporter [Anaerolineae bacterium]
MSRNRLYLISAGIMISLFLASMEGTVVATAMPSIVAQLGGLSMYSWVFAIFMLTTTTTIPLYGKFSDLYGRKSVFVVSLGLFMIGSLLCGSASSMQQLVIFRGLQGLGAGGVIPLAYTIVGEIFPIKQRARMQGLFSSVWGISSVIGPLIGGFLVDQVSWSWVFYINLPLGLLALALVWFAWRDAPRNPADRVAVDGAGALLLMAGVLALLLGLNELGRPLGLWLIAASLAIFLVLYFVERRAVDPILPLRLFPNRVFVIAILGVFFSGWAAFGTISYVPLFVQAVLGTSATQAGITLAPMSLVWTLASIICGRILLRVGYRALILVGMTSLLAGALLMLTIGVQTTPVDIMLYTSLMGIGMGLTLPAFTIAIQAIVRREELGVATSSLEFGLNIGGTLGVSVMGAMLSARLAALLLRAGIDPAQVSLGALIDPLPGASAVAEGPLRLALSGAIVSMFVLAVIPALCGLVVALFIPPGNVTQVAEKYASRPASE